MSTNGREELARRLQRIFLANADTGEEVQEATLLGFADDILAGDYTDRRTGPRKGDGGPPMALVPERSQSGSAH